MRRIKIILLLFLLGANSIILSGCWNYRELDELMIIMGAAIDKDKETNKYILTVETVKSKTGKGGENSMITDILSMEGDSVFDAARNLIMRSGKRLYWSHAKVIVISEEVAKEGMVGILDFITRDAEARADMWILISKEKSAKTLLEGKVKLHDTLAMHIENMLESEKNISKYYAIELWNFLSDLSTEGIAAVLPTATMIPKADERIPEIYGTAVFKKDKMIGWLDGIDTRSLMLIRGKLKGGLVLVVDVSNSGENVALEVFKSETKVKPVIKDNNIMMHIDVKMDVGIGEILGTQDFISQQGRNKLKEQAQAMLEAQIARTLKKVQKEYKSDNFGFGSIIQREMPGYWKKIHKNWNEIFPNVDTRIRVTINIKESALMSKPIKVGD
ncbi:Ger(x)C family spore germination protein [Clostridiaceae bacterium 35-E11]